MSNGEQAAYWSGEVGRKWVEHERLLEETTREVTDRLLGEAALRPGRRVLEVGCGSGGLALAMARAVGRGGEVLGIDISGPLIARAEQRRDEAALSQLRFRVEDAAVAELPEGSFDLVVSQFAAMFFHDPVAAFIHLRGALRPSGRLLLAAWGPASENPLFALARAVAVRQFGAPPAGPAEGPGPFAFADPEKVGGLLREAGFVEVRAEAMRFVPRVPGGIAAAAELAAELGPAAGMLRASGGGAAERAALVEAMREALAPYDTAEGARIPACANLFAARRS